MKFDSPLFDRIRVKPDKDRRAAADGPACEWPGCKENATHRAPKGRSARRNTGASASSTCANTIIPTIFLPA